ncbi:hypothetical protein HanXRQr2_Chr05g0204551 [Helianthus annuus]|uniref:Uncharacterized protein n=1 Tax=Helianthus annuus TaxID=4232 RepID=A0A9K3IXI6_HELAN|nr:hypothetical protein HanXRQr2_Chr05g0204551 [Helianthus annuus]KAJ0921909.1 hypothetical protein HanPSC8_Chr05g0197231 [Helianthus annuus]
MTFKDFLFSVSNSLTILMRNSPKWRLTSIRLRIRIVKLLTFNRRVG